jgi:hypothetical protein
MTKSTVERHVLLTPKQKAEAAGLRARGFTRSQAWLRVLTLKQRQVFYEQVRIAERLRYIENPYREIVKRARNARNSACRRGANTMLGISRLRRMTSTGQRTAPSCHG